MSIQLKVKIKTLQYEAREIRTQERLLRRTRKGDDPLVRSLADHRRSTVRHEARHSHLAYGFLRGRPYRSMERKCHEDPNWKAVERMVTRFAEGDIRDVAQRFEQWKQEGRKEANI